MLDKKLDLPRGLSPVVIVFDNASPEQFRYIENNGKLEIDPTSGLGIWLDFRKTHPEWSNKAVYCLLSGASAGHNFFGDRGIQGQKSNWRFQKVKWLADNGFELCNHTLWHAQLNKFSDAVVQEQIGREALAIDSAVPGYKARSMALPQGLWPKNRALASKGSWTNPRNGKVVSYDYPVVFEVAGGPMRSPYDPAFKPGSTPRIQVIGNAIESMINKLEKIGQHVHLRRQSRRRRAAGCCSCRSNYYGRQALVAQFVRSVPVSRARGPLRRYARLVGAPNCAPSLRSVAGLLLALALQSGYEDPSPSFPPGP